MKFNGNTYGTIFGQRSKNICNCFGLLANVCLVQQTKNGSSRALTVMSNRCQTIICFFKWGIIRQTLQTTCVSPRWCNYKQRGFYLIDKQNTKSVPDVLCFTFIRWCWLNDVFLPSRLSIWGENRRIIKKLKHKKVLYKIQSKNWALQILFLVLGRNSQQEDSFSFIVSMLSLVILFFCFVVSSFKQTHFPLAQSFMLFVCIIAVCKYFNIRF